MMDTLREILRTTVGKIIAAVVGGVIAVLGAVQTGLIDMDQEDLNPISVEEQPVEE